MIPVLDKGGYSCSTRLDSIWVNVKEISFRRCLWYFSKANKANFKVLGPRFGKDMKLSEKHSGFGKRYKFN